MCETHHLTLGFVGAPSDAPGLGPHRPVGHLVFPSVSVGKKYGDTHHLLKMRQMFDQLNMEVYHPL
jgi:hypothetical protein